jgi:hypothetical protein
LAKVLTTTRGFIETVNWNVKRAPKSGKKATGKRHVHGGTITFALPKAEEEIVVFFTK